MAQDIDGVIDRINSFMASGPDEDPDTEYRLYRLLEGFDDVVGKSAAVEPLFRLLERNSEADLGSPGPVVQALEAIPSYEPCLMESLRRIPTYYTVWMINRILNVELPAEEQAKWLAELKQARNHPDADDTVVASVAEFLKHQADTQE